MVRATWKCPVSCSRGMRRMLQATDGKVFTLTTMHLLIEHTRIKEYRVR